MRTALRRPVTAQYPEPEKRQPVQDRFMGFPALTWDYEVVEPYCTGCMVCIRDCPTQCMSAKMTDNPKAADGTSSRRKIIETFEINLGRCILCGICVDVCNFDAIEMSHEHELSKYERNGNRADLDRLLELGREYQDKVSWKPTQPEKNSGVPKPGAKRPAAAKPAVADAEGKPSSEMTKEERLAAARARAAAKKRAQASDDAVAEDPPVAKGDMSPEDRVAAARARAAAKKQAQAADDAVAEAPPDAPAKAKSDMSPEERVAAARARAAVKKQAQASGVVAAEAPPVAKGDMTPEERVAAARARAAAKKQASSEFDAKAEEDPGEGVTD